MVYHISDRPCLWNISCYFTLCYFMFYLFVYWFIYFYILQLLYIYGTIYIYIIISYHDISYHIILYYVYIYILQYIYMYVCVEFEEMPPWLSQVTNPQHHSTLQKVRDLPHLRIKRGAALPCYLYHVIYIILYLWYVILINDHRIMYLLVVEWGEPSIMRIINQPVEKEHSANRLELSHQHLPSEVITSGYV